jgi:hypothetical protein
MTYAQKERGVAESLDRIGVECRNYQYKHQMVSRSRLIAFRRSVFARYIYLRPEGRYGEIRERVSDICGFVRRFNRGGIGEVIKVSPDEIAAIDAMLDPEGFYPLPPTPPRFRYGDRVLLVNSGPTLDGVEATYQCPIPGRPGKVIVLLPWLSQSIPTEVDEHQLTTKATEKKRKRRRGKRVRHRKYMTKVHPDLRLALAAAEGLQQGR